MAKQISISPSKLSDFLRCPRCFHDAYASKVAKPRGIFPSLPGGMDLIMKKYVDQFRGDVPPGLKGLVPGVLYSNLEQMNKWRYWGTGPTYINNDHDFKLIGALDDCLVDDGCYIPLDWKTKGSMPDDDGSQYYQTQMDCYNLMLEAQGHPVRNEAHLVYIWPSLAHTHYKPPTAENAEKEARIGSVVVAFGYTPFKIACNKDRALDICIKAVECLRGKRPESAFNCEHCLYLQALSGMLKQMEVL